MEYDFNGIIVTAMSFDGAVAHLKEFHPRVFAEYAAGKVDVTTPDTAEQARIAAIASTEKDQNALILKLGKAMFFLVNEVLTAKGQTAITAAQFKAWVLSL